MPLGPYGYEPEPMEEPEAEREPSKITVQGVGCFLLTLMAIGAIVTFWMSTGWRLPGTVAPTPEGSQK
jgi:hypothetical protein